MISKATLLLSLLFLGSAFCKLNAQISLGPKREFRGAWLTTVANLDWPSSPALSTAKQQQELLTILDSLKSIGVNAIMFQVRPAADAFYGNGNEPWSRYLTGKQGIAPDPYYDPLYFVIQEAHNRGMELHAWFNPYRASLDLIESHFYANHITKLKPEWFFTYDGQKIFNPGLPQVRKYITNIVMYVVRNYDIDGVHFDDYFYPDQTKNNPIPDMDTYHLFATNGIGIKDWRRQNVDSLIETLSDSIHKCKKYVKFGISPFGVWKNKSQDIDGSNTNGGSSYYELYADTRKWLINGWIDYINPQLYWPLNHRLVPFEKILDWWGNNSYGRHLYIGQAAYRAGENVQGFRDRSEISNEIRYLRNNASVQGSVFFRAKSLISNIGGITDSLRINFYNHLALQPGMRWLDSIPPNPPRNLSVVQISHKNIQLRWTLPSKAPDNDTAYGYVVYRFADGEKLTIDDPSHILSISFDSSRTVFTDSQSLAPGKYTYIVTAIDRLKNESRGSQSVNIQVLL